MAGTALTALQIASSYSGLLKTGDNAVLNGTLRTIGDGTGVDSALQVSTAGVNSTGTLAATGHVTFEGVTSTGATGTGKLVYDASPTLVTPNLGTPSAAVLTSATGLPISTGVSGLGTGIATALAVNTGSAGAPVLFNGALGTPASGTVTNLTGTASININGTVGATTASTGAFTTLSASGAINPNGYINFNSLSAPTNQILNYGAGNLQILSGNYFNGSAYIAQTATPTQFNMASGNLYVYADTGKTVGSSYTPTLVSLFSYTGLAVTGALSASGSATDIFTATTTGSGRTAYFQNNTTYALVDIRAGGTNQSAYLGLVPSGTGSGIIQLNGSDKLTISSTGLAVTGSVGVSGSGTFSTTSNGLNLNAADPTAYRIGFDNLGGTVGYTRHNIVAGGTTNTWGHVFSTSQSGTPNTFTNSLFVGASGNVGINTSTPAKTLDVSGTVQFRDGTGAGQAFWVQNKGIGATNSGAFGLGYNAVNFTPGSTPSALLWDGSSGWFTILTSSRKYKRNIVAVTDEQLDKALLLRPSYYQRNEYEYHEYGFIAEEVNEIGLDEFVTRYEGEITGLAYDKMVTLAIGLAQRQAKENANLVAELQSVRARLATLESK